VIESGVGLSALLVTPFSCLTLWSFDDTAICAEAGATASPNAPQTPVSSPEFRDSSSREIAPADDRLQSRLLASHEAG